jgi:aminoglycoside phosphotransferase family enzyme
MSADQLEQIPLAEKVAVLSRPSTYAQDRPTQVEARQTHMAWVFLTDRYVFKLKKPVRYPFLDFSTIALRRHDCEAEVRLNRRLAPDVYLGIEPLTLAVGQELRLGPHGEVVDWLVAMRRLPAELMLDQLLRGDGAEATLVERLGRRLAAFYATARPAALSPETYLMRLHTMLRESWQELARAGYRLPTETVEAALGRELEFLERGRRLLAGRAEDGRIVEGHGDLRPEHVCLAQQPVVIDCLEFNRDLRLVDPADELAFLALECELLGNSEVGERIIGQYAASSGDRPSISLIGFYKSARATLRARLMAAHSLEPGDRPPAVYLERARQYLERALAYTDLFS